MTDHKGVVAYSKRAREYRAALRAASDARTEQLVRETLEAIERSRRKIAVESKETILFWVSHGWPATSVG